AGAVIVNLRRMWRYGYAFFQVMDPAVVALALGIAIGRIGDLVIGDHLGKPTSWPLAWTYHGGTLAPPWICVSDTCSAVLPGAQREVISRGMAALTAANGDVLARGVGVHQTALYDMVGAWALFAVLWRMQR